MIVSTWLYTGTQDIYPTPTNNSTQAINDSYVINYRLVIDYKY